MKDDSDFLKLALQEAQKSPQGVYYAVGCLIVSADGKLISTGYTGERLYSDTAWHAEETAIKKAQEQEIVLKGSTLYSTMEPCSERRSGHTPCTELIIKAGIKKVVFALYEPFDDSLGIRCCGEKVLQSAGVEVVFLEKLSDLCLHSIKRCRRN